MSGAIAAATGRSIELELIPPFDTSSINCIPISGAETVVNIIGNGETFDANQVSQFFQVSNATLVISAVTFMRGKPTGFMCGHRVDANQRSKLVRAPLVDANSDLNGGALLLDSSSILQLTDCKFVNNIAYGIGGGIYSAGPGDKIQLKGCSFIGNVATDGQFSTGGGAIVTYGTLLAVDCYFVNNSATMISPTNMTGQTGAGGAIMAGGTTQLTNCTFSGNVAPGPTPSTAYGGAIYFGKAFASSDGGASTAVLVGCSFAGYSAVNHNDIARAETAKVMFSCPSGTTGVPLQMKSRQLLQPPSLNCTPV
jgi:hypothetical protein